MPLAAVMRSPRYVDIAITSKCNLRCKYCYFFDRRSVNYIDLPTAEWLKFFEELGNMAVLNIGLFGGEPFLRTDIKDIIKGIVHNRMRFYIGSNGTLVNDDIANFIKKTGRCDLIQISLDGSCADIHDAIRGRGSFKGAVRGIKTLQKHGIPVTVRVTINHHNVHDLENMARFILDDLGLSIFQCFSSRDQGSFRKHADEIKLTVKDNMSAMATLLKLSEKYPGKISAASTPLLQAKSWKEMEEARIQKKPGCKMGGHLIPCGDSFKNIHVHSDGTITPCTILGNINMGRINQDSFSEVWLNSPVLNNMRSRYIPLADFEFCQGCEYIPYCKGTCPVSAYSMTGKLDHPDQDTCLRAFLRNGGKLP